MIVEPIWAASIRAASYLHMELTLFALVLISYYLFVVCIREVAEPVGSQADRTADKSPKPAGRFKNRHPALKARALKSKNAMAMKASTVDATTFVEDIYPSINSQHLGMHLEA